MDRNNSLGTTCDFFLQKKISLEKNVLIYGINFFSNSFTNSLTNKSTNLKKNNLNTTCN